MAAAREDAGYPTRAAGAEALQDAGIDVKEGRLGTYERDEIAPQIDVFLGICETFNANPLYVLIGLGPRRWSEIDDRESPGRVAEPSTPYGFANGVTPELQVPVAPEERRALALVAKQRQTTVPKLVRELIDLPSVIATEERILQAIDSYDAATDERN